MKIDYATLIEYLPGQCVVRPNDTTVGTLSGHAAGEPFANFVCNYLKQQYPEKVFKQYEYLNELYMANRRYLSYEQRMALLPSPTLGLLLNRGMSATTAWRVDKQFTERQNDTADIVFCTDTFCDLIDVKSHAYNKKAQPPNIISAYKVAEMCTSMIDNNDYDSFDMNYIEVDWLEENNLLRCNDAYYANLFLAQPEELYINWAAGMQIQFFVRELKQDFYGDRREWAIKYLNHFVASATRRCEEMQKKFIQPYQRYLDLDPN